MCDTNIAHEPKMEADKSSSGQPDVEIGSPRTALSINEEMIRFQD
jgi:hypothetical protein